MSAQTTANAPTAVQKITETALILFVSGWICVIANIVGYKATLADSLIGTAVLIVIGLLGFILNQLPYCNKFYAVIWISILSIFASSPAFPWQAWVVATTSKVQFMAIATTVLAFAGLSVGKDLEAFKKLSWRIVPVALAVCAGTFLGAVVIAQVALHWEGAI